MNRLKAEVLWPIMKAFAKGADIQMQDPETDDWLNVPNPTFAPEIRWRIKPENEAFENWWGETHRAYSHLEKSTALKAWNAAKRDKTQI